MDKITPNNINPSCPNCGVHHTGRCQLFKRASPEDDILWSDSAYSLPEMNERFTSRLPYLAWVGLGDFGDTEESTIEIGQVLRVAKHYDQPRVIGISANGTVLSIPLSLPLKFDIMRSKTNNLTTRFTDTVRGVADSIRSPKAFSRGKLLSEFTKKLPVTISLCENAYSEAVMTKGSFSYEDVRQLTLTKVHKYSYLVCNEVTGGVLNTMNTLLMPTFMRMKLKISTGGLKSDSEFCLEQLQQLQDSLTESSNQIDYNELLEPQEIFHYEGAYDKNTQYEGLQPTEYVQHMYTRSRHPLFALVSSHGHKMMRKVKKAFSSSNPTSSQQPSLEDEEGVYETIELTKERRFYHSKYKPRLPPKPKPDRRSAQPRVRENHYDNAESGPVHPESIKKPHINAVGPSQQVQAELAERLQLHRNYSVSHAYEDITNLTVLEVGDILDKLNLRKYKLKFFHQQIDGSILRDLVADDHFDFETQFEMDNLEVKKLRKCVKENWLPNL